MLVSLCLVQGRAAAETPLQALHATLDRQHLAASPAWRSLLHIPPGEQQSEVVDSWFFLAAQGRQDAAAELHATLDALIDDRPVPLRDEPAHCVFAARRAFLAGHLGEAFTALAANTECPRREAWLKSLDVQALWLVFPTGYLNSPSSMFGHTLLRVDSKESQTGGPLLAYAANFVAETSEANGLVFAVKGLAGGYVGRYGVLPYYEKVREYVRLENRDLWEYPLLLDASEQQQLMWHLWELRGAGFTYYFFSRNCAYQLLALLQTVRPAQDFLGSFGTWAIPTDTIRTLQHFGVLGPPKFRPALATTLLAHAEQLQPSERQQAAAMSAGRIGPEALAAELPQTQARVLDVAHDLTYLRYQNGGQRDVLLKIDRQLLAARAATATSSSFDPVPTPSRPPDQGHQTQRLAVGWLAQEGTSSLLLRYRPSYHDLLDDPAGYTSGSQISFGDTAVRADLGEGQLKLQDFKLIDIVSLAARDALRQPISWRTSVGARREATASSPLRGYLDGAPGLAWGGRDGFVYAYLPLSFESGPGLSRGYDVRAGAELSMQALLTPRLRSVGSLMWQGGIAGAARELRRGTLGTQMDLDANWGLRAEVVAESYSDARPGFDYSGLLSLQHYF